MDLSAIQAAVDACIAQHKCGTTQDQSCVEAYTELIVQALEVTCGIVHPVGDHQHG